jgi:hypothetical protein
MGAFCVAGVRHRRRERPVHPPAEPVASTVPWVVALAAPLVAFGGGVTMSLPYALLMPMMPRGAHPGRGTVA